MVRVKQVAGIQLVVNTQQAFRFQVSGFRRQQVVRVQQMTGIQLVVKTQQNFRLQVSGFKRQQVVRVQQVPRVQQQVFRSQQMVRIQQVVGVQQVDRVQKMVRVQHVPRMGRSSNPARLGKQVPRAQRGSLGPGEVNLQPSQIRRIQSQRPVQARNQAITKSNHQS